ncbi:PAS domain S-box protein [Mucilaginibacter sp. PAMB04274]|uniref:PAS domain S-box protein n=1 Tax=Mucilaginibacter sp. PAMB04274 TaxID=3138568 RepID=UPI0031F6D507
MESLQNDIAALRALIEESPTPIGLYTGPEMRIHFANKAMIVGTWGKDASVIGKTLHEALPELDGQPFHQLLQDVYSSGTTYEAKEDLVKLVVDGVLQDYFYNFTYKPLFDKDGVVWAILNTATNVTDLVLARKRADEAEQQLAFSLTAAGIGTWDLNLQHQLVTWDDRVKQLFGFSKDDVVAYDEVLNCMHPDDQLMVDGAVNWALNPQSGGQYNIKFRTIGVEDGQLRWLHCRGKAYFNGEGKAIRFSGIAQDISSQVIADEKAHTAEQLAQLALENIDAGSFLIHLPTNNITYTPLFAKILTGNDTTGITRNAFIDYVHPDDRQLRQAAYDEAMKTGKLLYEARFVWNDGSVHWAKVLGRYSFENDKPVHFAGIVQDITAEAEARQEQQKLLWLIENSNDFISLSDWSGKLTYLNHAGVQMMDFDSLEEAKRHLAEYVMPSEVEKIHQVINPTLLKEGRWEGQVMYRNFKTGEPIPGFATTLLLRDTATGEPVGNASVVRDLRPEIEARKALIDSEEVFRAITTASPAALWMCNDEGGITYVNKVWINWTGKELSAHLGAGWLNSIATEDLEFTSNKFKGDFQAQRFHECQFRLKHIDGTTRWVVCTGNPQYSAEGFFKGYIGACVDITEQKQLQQQKDEFIGIASHELKTPVTSIKAYTQVLQAVFQREGDEKKANMLNKMNAQVDRLTSLIGDLLDVTKIQSGRLQFNDDYFDFGALAGELIEDLQRTTTKHQIITELQPGITVYADRDRIGQVITNLITNAIKYSPLADKIIIKTTVEGDELNLCVQDFGIGISADKKDRVFEQFYRVSGDKQHTFPGLGLGLYISSEIIQREGGRIWVNSVVGEGSTFCISLPLHR